MNEKLSFQSIADTLAKKSGVSKKVADTFSKAFFDTIVEALGAGEVIKIKGLGTFKLVEVGDRESVNVTTGKRFVIPGYKKLAFTAEDSVVEVLSGRLESVQEIKEEIREEVKEEVKVEVEEVKEVAKEEVKAEKPVEIEKLIQVPEPEQVEQPQDKFAGIDMLISTPESVEDVRQQYEEAKARMETAVEEARKANAEKLRLEKLLERLEKNVEPEAVAPVVIETEAETPIESNTSSKILENNDSEIDKNLEEEKRQEAFKRVMTEQPKTQEPEPQEEKTSKKSFWVTAAVILLLAVLGTFVYLIHQNIEAVEKVQKTEQTQKPAKPEKPTKATQPAKPVKPATPKVDKDSLAKAQKADSIKVAKEAKEAKDTKDVKDTKVKEEPKPERPTIHRMQRGESLTRVSQKYYGTKDSVRAILRVNTFADPDNIPVGAVVKLP